MGDKTIHTIREIGWVGFSGAGAMLWATFLPNMVDNITRGFSYLGIVSLSLMCLMSIVRLIIVLGGKG